jgi:hypothetical protein
VAFEPGNLIAQLLINLFEFGHSVRQEPNDSQQRFHKGRAFFAWKWPAPPSPKGTARQCFFSHFPNNLTSARAIRAHITK